MCSLVVWSSVVNSLFEVRPRQASGLACVRDLGVRGLVGVAAPGRDPLCNTPLPEYVLSCVFRFFDRIFRFTSCIYFVL